jgi:hypothetical protein
MGAKTAFLSYSHDSKYHIAAAIALADRLSREGVVTSLDKYQDSPPEGWPKWMDRQVRNASFVIVVCTEGYKVKYENPGSASGGRGAKWESLLAVQRLYEAGGFNERLVPVLFSDDDAAHIIAPLAPFTHYKTFTTIDPAPVWNEEEYIRLYRHLTGQPEYVQPKPGEVVVLPPKNLPTTNNSAHVGPREPTTSSAQEMHDPTESDQPAGGVAVLMGQVEVKLTLDKPWNQHSQAEKRAVQARVSKLLEIEPNRIVIVDAKTKSEKGGER